MKKLSLGYMINNIRTTMGVTLEELAEGLCTPSTMFRYETGERIPDSLLFYTFMQRLGKSPSRINIMVSKEEAAYFKWKNAVFDAVKRKDWEEVRRQKEKQEKKGILINEKLQKQFALYVEAILWDKLEQRPDKAAECMESAMKCTIPDPKSWDGKNSILCGDEINLFLIYLKYQLQMGRMEQKRQIKYVVI